MEKFVSSAKNLLMQNITELLQQYYGIWIDGHSIPVEQLSNQDPDIVHTAKMYNPQIQISAESETKRSIFREKDKTKRSKKESAQHSKSRNKSFVMTSVSAL